MKVKNKQKWIEEGYHMVALTGWHSLNIESIARTLNKSKSSFYYYFGDKEIFEEVLLEWHLYRIKEFNKKIRLCKNIRPDFVYVLIEYRIEMLFQKQLHINREQPSCKKYLTKSLDDYALTSIDLWQEYFDFPNNRMFVNLFIYFFAENFLLRVSLENFTHEWIDNYIKELYQMIQLIKKKK